MRVFFILLFLACSTADAQIYERYLKLSQQQANQSAPTANLYTNANAANESNETNSIGDFSEVGTTLTTISVESTTVHDGSFAIRLENTSGLSNQTFEIQTQGFTATIGTTYEVRMWVNRITGSDNWTVQLRDNAGWVASQFYIKPPSNTWSEVVLIAEADGTAPIISFGLDNGNDDGDALIVDNIRITAL